MKLTAFKYTDNKGKITNRRVLVIQEPTDKLMGLDVSELSDEDVAVFAGQYNAAQERFIREIETLKDAFDVTHNLRQFMAIRIEDPVTEYL